MKKPGYDPADVSVLIHTALRKCCDSDITSLAYVLIHALPPGPWGAFCTELQSHAKKEDISKVDVFRKALKAMRANMPKDLGVRAIMLTF